MRQNPTRGAELIDALCHLRGNRSDRRCHHERYDGSGYPRALSGDDIPPLARAIAVVDAFSAMVHDRPYRKGLTGDEAIAELQLGKGTQFDPQYVDSFVQAIGRVSEPIAVAASRLRRTPHLGLPQALAPRPQLLCRNGLLGNAVPPGPVDARRSAP